MAVCLLPGTEVAFESEVERDHPFGRLLPSMQFGWLVSGRSIWIARTRITTPWNCPTQRRRGQKTRRVAQGSGPGAQTGVSVMAPRAAMSRPSRVTDSRPHERTR